MTGQIERITQPPQPSSLNDFNKAAKPSIRFDPTPYLHHLSDMTISDEEKEKLIKTLWAIILGLIDMGLEVHPVQHALKTQSKERRSSQPCGKASPMNGRHSEPVLNLDQTDAPSAVSYEGDLNA